MKWLMPALFILLVAMVAYAMVTGDFSSALNYLFKPDFDKISGETVLAALGQAFFSLSLGMGSIIVYGAYLSKETSIVQTTFIIGAVDTLVALLAGLVIFPIVFAYGLEPGSGPGLVFVSLTIAFGQMPGGQIFGSLFFTLLTVAAWTSAISLLEPVTAWLIEQFNWSRLKASMFAGFGAWFAWDWVFVVLQFVAGHEAVRQRFLWLDGVFGCNGDVAARRFVYRNLCRMANG